MAERKTTRPRGTVSPADELQLGSHSRIFNDEDVLLLLRAAVEREGNQGAFARRHGLERTYLNQGKPSDFGKSMPPNKQRFPSCRTRGANRGRAHRCSPAPDFGALLSPADAAL